jgi:hypothetical protein
MYVFDMIISTEASASLSTDCIEPDLLEPIQEVLIAMTKEMIYLDFSGWPALAGDHPLHLTLLRSHPAKRLLPWPTRGCRARSSGVRSLAV